MRAIYFCPIEGCPAVLADAQGLREHLRRATHKGEETPRDVIERFVSQNCFWPLSKVMADAIFGCPQKLHAYVMLHSMAEVALCRTFYAAPGSPLTRVANDVIMKIRPRFKDHGYKLRIDRHLQPTHNPVGH